MIKQKVGGEWKTLVNFSTPSGEPEKYLKEAAVSDNSLIITNNNGSTITYAPTSASVEGTAVKSTGVEAHKVLTANGAGEAGWEEVGGGEPDTYIKSASASGNTLTLTNKDDTTVTFTPSTDLSAYSTTEQMNTAISNHHDSTKQDTLTAGSNVTITGNTISATDTTYSEATTEAAGLESAADKTKLDSLVAVSGTNDGTNWSTITIDGTTKAIPNGGSSGEPAAYLKSASTSGNTLTLTNKDNTTVEFTPTTDLSAYSTTEEMNNAISNHHDNSKQDVIDSEHTLSADLIADGTTNIIPTATDETNWNAKSVVSGTDDGTNWTAITIDGTTKSIPAGGSGSISGLANGTGTNSLKIGNFNTNSNATQNGAIILGSDESQYSSHHSTGAGALTYGCATNAGSMQASGMGALAGGTATGAGYTILASGTGSIAVGYALEADLKATKSGAIAIGTGVQSLSAQQTALGKFNVADSSNVYALILGNGTDNSNRSNALTVDWNGNLVCNNIPAPPSTNGTYNLQCSIVDGAVTYSWVAQA